MQGFGQGWDKAGGQPEAVLFRCHCRCPERPALVLRKGTGDLWPPVAFSGPAAFSVKADAGNGKGG